MEDRIAQACEELQVPRWVKSILKVAAKKKNDRLRRKKAYKMLQRRLWYAGIGHEFTRWPTYVYPIQIKTLIRSLFPEDICDYPDPDHERVVKVTLEHLYLVRKKKSKSPR